MSSGMEDLFDEEIGASKEPQAKKARPPTSTAKSLGDSSEVRAKQKRFTLTLKDRYAAKRAGAGCTICGCKDTDADRVEPTEKMLWGYYTTSCNIELIVQTQGATCWYCLRVWNVRFMQQFKKVSDYKNAVTQD
jgi:hypothetical protein